MSLFFPAPDCPPAPAHKSRVKAAAAATAFGGEGRTSDDDPAHSLRPATILPTPVLAPISDLAPVPSDGTVDFPALERLARAQHAEPLPGLTLPAAVIDLPAVAPAKLPADAIAQMLLPDEWIDRPWKRARRTVATSPLGVPASAAAAPPLSSAATAGLSSPAAPTVPVAPSPPPPAAAVEPTPTSSVAALPVPSPNVSYLAASPDFLAEVPRPCTVSVGLVAA